MDSRDDDILRPLRERGYRVSVVSAGHISELQREIESRRESGELDTEFHTLRLAWFKFQFPESLPDAKSIIVVAVPRPQTQAIFNWNGRRRPLSLPPTYTSYDQITQQVTDQIAAVLEPSGYHVAKTDMPLKLLAARSGVVQYGRNNVTYAPGLGSFLQLVAVYSDMPCTDDKWQGATMMAACESCNLCRKACPTGAIPSGRFLLHAERCIVFHNEKPGNIPFPAWMKPSWHNCIVGCFHCQRACPPDRRFMRWTGEREEFSEQETALLLDGVPAEKLPAETLGKLERLSLLDYLDQMPRNLGVFFRKQT